MPLINPSSKYGSYAHPTAKCARRQHLPQHSKIVSPIALGLSVHSANFYQNYCPNLLATSVTNLPSSYSLIEFAKMDQLFHLVFEITVRKNHSGSCVSAVQSLPLNVLSCLLVNLKLAGAIPAHAAKFPFVFPRR